VQIKRKGLVHIAFDTKYVQPLPPNHRFPMEKYELIPEQLLYEGSISSQNLFIPRPATDQQILRVHDSKYLENLKNVALSKKEVRKMGFPLNSLLVEREILIAGGTIQCCDYAFQEGISLNVAGGTHHAYAEHGEGFCLLNDIAIAAQYLLDENRSEQIAVIDLDVHQGNGTASLFKNVPEVFTFSMHGEKNYPLPKEKSDWDIELPDGTGDNEYLNTLATALEQIWKNVKPDFVFFQSGVDVLHTDKLGRLGLTKKGCLSRDRMVFEQITSRKLPCVTVMGGGYSERLSDIVEAHSNTFREAIRWNEVRSQ
jgi:acetoin utilization deacetylase AcuC-like enzyme